MVHNFTFLKQVSEHHPPPQHSAPKIDRSSSVSLSSNSSDDNSDDDVVIKDAFRCKVSLIDKTHMYMHYVSETNT